MSSRWILALAAVVVLLGAGVLAYPRIFGDRSTPQASAPTRADAGVAPSPAIDATVAVAVVAIRATNGTVERRVGDDDLWQPVEVGEELAIDDVIRTGADGALVLAVGAAEVRLDPDSTIGVAQLERAVTRLRIDDGRVAAVVPPGGGGLGIAVGEGGAVAETDEGEFSVLSTGDGGATVASTAGEVKVTSAGKTVAVPAGRQTRVAKGAAPTAPRAIPTSLFLKVKSSRKVLQKTTYSVRGETSPGAVISVNGVKVQVDENGEFVSVVTLREGKNEVTVRGRDATGRTQRSTVGLVVDTKGPRVGGDVQWGQEK